MHHKTLTTMASRGRVRFRRYTSVMDFATLSPPVTYDTGMCFTSNTASSQRMVSCD